MKFKVLFVLLSLGIARIYAQNILYKSPEYTLYGDSVVQGTSKAYAASNKELHTTFQNSYIPVYDRKLEYKLSINGIDNELKAGINHTAVIIPKDGSFTTRVVFDQPDNKVASNRNDTLEYDIKFRFEADLREVVK
ncbi:MAG TPA: hypothetical protein VF691_08455, partial [Cytophagaceae bacterium]